MQSAGRDPIEGDDALKALEGVRTLLVAKGRKVERFDLADDRPGDEELLSMLLGRSGKLRAPAMRRLASTRTSCPKRCSERTGSNPVSGRRTSRPGARHAPRASALVGSRRSQPSTMVADQRETVRSSTTIDGMTWLMRTP